jgi:hypothetical protein
MSGLSELRNMKVGKKMGGPMSLEKDVYMRYFP